MADGFAKDGFVAVAPALFDRIQPGIELGYTPDTIAEGRGYVMTPGFTEKAVQDVEAAIKELKSLGAKNRDVIMLFLCEAGIIGLIGGVSVIILLK